MLHFTKQRKAVFSRYLFSMVAKWAAIFGIVNLAAIATSLGYIFIVLPKQAASEAKAIVELQASSELQFIKGRFSEIDLLYGRALQRLEDAERTAKLIVDTQTKNVQSERAMEDRLNIFAKQVAELEKTDPGTMAKLIAEFNNSPNVEAIIKKLEAVERNNQEVKSTVTQMQVPIGTIVAWNGKSKLPDGWAICDGDPRIGTPDLRGLFLKGVVNPSDANVRDDIKVLTAEIEVQGSNRYQLSTVEGPWTGQPRQINIPPNYSVVYIMRIR